MFDPADIRAVQKVRCDLSSDQAGEILGFLNDTYSVKPYVMENPELFKAAADLIYPEVENV